MQRRSLFFIVLLLADNTCPAQDDNHPSFTGTWKGESICQIKPSACNDEIAVYHVSKTGKQDIYHIVMNKVIAGTEEEMAAYDYVYDEAKGMLTAKDDQRDLIWTFWINNRNMNGTLVHNHRIYRIITLTKTD